MLHRCRVTALPAAPLRFAQVYVAHKKPPGEKSLPQFCDVLGRDPGPFRMGHLLFFYSNPVRLHIIVIGTVHPQPVHRIVHITGKLHRLTGMIALVFPDLPVKVIHRKQVVSQGPRCRRTAGPFRCTWCDSTRPCDTRGMFGLGAAPGDDDTCMPDLDKMGGW